MNLNDTEMSVVNSSGKGQAKGIILALCFSRCCLLFIHNGNKSQGLEN